MASAAIGGESSAAKRAMPAICDISHTPLNDVDANSLASLEGSPTTGRRSRAWSWSLRRGPDSEFSPLSVFQTPVLDYISDLLPEATRSDKPVRYMTVNLRGVTVRSGIELTSPKVAVLPESTFFDVFEQAVNKSGSIRMRMRMDAGGCGCGWVSEFSAQDGGRLIAPAALPDSATSSFKPRQYTVVSPRGVTVRSGVELASAKVHVLPANTQFDVLEEAISEPGSIRMRMADGWISEVSASSRAQLIAPVVPKLPTWATCFVGTWLTIRGKTVAILGKELVGAEDFQATSATTCSAEVLGKTFQGELVGDSIRWNDGDVWRKSGATGASGADEFCLSLAFGEEDGPETSSGARASPLKTTVGSSGPCVDLSFHEGPAAGKSASGLLMTFFRQAKPSKAMDAVKELARLLQSRAALAASDPRHRAATCGAAGGAVVCGGMGGAAGFTVGGAFGALCGAVPALFTLGLSIPFGAAVGGGTGLCIGTTMGGSAGIAGGAAAGYGVYDTHQRRRLSKKESDDKRGRRGSESETTCSSEPESELVADGGQDSNSLAAAAL